MENTYRLPKEFADKWISALRSGEYKQGDEVLMASIGNDQFEYCCLGIACVVSGEPLERYLGAETIKLGLKIPLELIGTAHNNELVSKLTELNDRKGYSFTEIADWIEQNITLY